MEQGCYLSSPMPTLHTFVELQSFTSCDSFGGWSEQVRSQDTLDVFQYSVYMFHKAPACFSLFRHPVAFLTDHPYTKVNSTSKEESLPHVASVAEPSSLPIHHGDTNGIIQLLGF